MQRLVFGVARITANIPLDLDSSTTDIQLYPKRSLNGTPFHVPEPRKAIVGLCCLTLPAAFAEVRLTLALLGLPGALAYTYSLHCSSFLGLTKFILRILKGNPQKELQWRLKIV